MFFSSCRLDRYNHTSYLIDLIIPTSLASCFKWKLQDFCYLSIPIWLVLRSRGAVLRWSSGEGVRGNRRTLWYLVLSLFIRLVMLFMKTCRLSKVFKMKVHMSLQQRTDSLIEAEIEGRKLKHLFENHFSLAPLLWMFNRWLVPQLSQW
jgi:hypothetical protein